MKYPATRLSLFFFRPLLMLCLPAVVWLLTAAAAADDVPPPPTPVAHRPGCPSKCGDVDIPYPFGIGDQCAIHHGFTMNCTAVNGTDRPFKGPFEVTSISVLDAKATMKMNISGQCFDSQMNRKLSTWYENFTNTPFRFSTEDNKIFVIGCNSLAYITSEYYSIGCLSQCYGYPRNASSCSSGAGCCEADVPTDMGYCRPYFNPDYNSTGCSYSVVMETKAFSYSTAYRQRPTAFWDAYNGRVPVVFDWVIRPYTCEDAKTNFSSSYACVSQKSECVNTTNRRKGYRCKCMDGYQGNPYVNGGCIDINECLQNTTNTCTAIGAICQNTPGNFSCTCPQGKEMMNGMCMAKKKSSAWVIPIIGTSLGLVVLIVTITCAYLIQQRRKLEHIKQRYFHQHGGMLLYEEIKSQQGNAFKIFPEAELQEATDKFSEQRVLGHGGHGIVYKGLLKGSVEVAVKRCMSIDEHHKKEFGKEMLILSQINHKNIVKLLGCCLEVQVPMLVYEFIPNGTLFQLIHGNRGRQISLATRVEIAHQSAEALAYLHSWASPPIIHGDVKTSNILIDRDCTAKLSDFGASILAPTDESQFVTLVQGTCGYLDPEYMQTCQLTDKSDVYSFGVVLLELLTRKMPFNLDGPEDEKSLATRFISLTKEGKLEEILDDQLKNDNDMGFLEETAELAMQCLEISGANRPSMRDISERLDRLRKVLQHPWAQQIPEEMESLLGESSLRSSEIAITGTLSIEKEAVKKLNRYIIAFKQLYCRLFGYTRLCKISIWVWVICSKQPKSVYEFVSNGTLYLHLHLMELRSLPWNDRLRMASETTEDIAYLHSAVSVPIIHRDINFKPSRHVMFDQTGITTKVQGTIGYIDPIYYYTRRMTEKSDEKKKPFAYVSSGEEGLVKHFIDLLSLEWQVREEGGKQVAEEVSTLEATCVKLNPDERPTVRETSGDGTRSHSSKGACFRKCHRGEISEASRT
ncbi:hypothetical protein U9M48_001873 [Paspalum notatum var. saurae]|uniref:Uncharacterized protein n=1 Tax=Paspalum notatum var. saurae TaxID=547442 RepID=A0AAQ3PFC6_PASNO